MRQGADDAHGMGRQRYPWSNRPLTDRYLVRGPLDGFEVSALNAHQGHVFGVVHRLELRIDLLI